MINTLKKLITTNNSIFKKGFYQHYKGDVYKVVGKALQTETNVIEVLYYDINKRNQLFARPLDMFYSDVEIGGKTVKRFKFISNEYY